MTKLMIALLVTLSVSYAGDYANMEQTFKAGFISLPFANTDYWYSKEYGDQFYEVRQIEDLLQGQDPFTYVSDRIGKTIIRIPDYKYTTTNQRLQAMDVVYATKYHVHMSRVIKVPNRRVFWITVSINASDPFAKEGYKLARRFLDSFTVLYPERMIENQASKMKSI